MHLKPEVVSYTEGEFSIPEHFPGIVDADGQDAGGGGIFYQDL